MIRVALDGARGVVREGSGEPVRLDRQGGLPLARQHRVVTARCALCRGTGMVTINRSGEVGAQELEPCAACSGSGRRREAN